MRFSRVRRCPPVLLVYALYAVLLVPAVSAQSFRPIIDHVHLAAPDPEKAVAWYRQHFGGQPMTEGVDRLLLGDARVIFSKRDSAQPSQGSAVDHIGFSVPDIDAVMKGLESSGATIEGPVRDVAGLFKLAFVVDPWGTRLEIVQDPQQLGLHHIHLRGPDPVATLAWYSAQFGGRMGKLKDRIDGLEMSGVWILAQKGESTPTAGHSIDHLGFRPVNVDASVAELKTRNVKILTEPRPLTFPNGTSVRLAFAEGPDGVRIEMVQRPE